METRQEPIDVAGITNRHFRIDMNAVADHGRSAVVAISGNWCIRALNERKPKVWCCENLIQSFVGSVERSVRLRKNLVLLPNPLGIGCARRFIARRN